jgi:hypothetical protein
LIIAVVYLLIYLTFKKGASLWKVSGLGYSCPVEGQLSDSFTGKGKPTGSPLARQPPGKTIIY